MKGGGSWSKRGGNGDVGMGTGEEGGYLRSAGRVLRYGQGGDRGKGRSLEYDCKMF